MLLEVQIDNQVISVALISNLPRYRTECPGLSGENDRG